MICKPLCRYRFHFISLGSLQGQKYGSQTHCSILCKWHNKERRISFFRFSPKMSVTLMKTAARVANSEWNLPLKNSLSVPSVPVSLSIQLTNQNMRSKRQRVHVLRCHRFRSPLLHQPSAKGLSISRSLQRANKLRDKMLHVTESREKKIKENGMRMFILGSQAHPEASGDGHSLLFGVMLDVWYGNTQTLKSDWSKNMEHPHARTGRSKAKSNAKKWREQSIQFHGTNIRI